MEEAFGTQVQSRHGRNIRVMLHPSRRRRWMAPVMNLMVEHARAKNRRRLARMTSMILERTLKSSQARRILVGGGGAARVILRRWCFVLRVSVVR